MACDDTINIKIEEQNECDINIQIVECLNGQSQGGAVDSVNAKTGVVVLDADDIGDASTTNKFTSEADINRLANTNGTNTGDETTATIQTKRPLKTVNGNVLDGSGNIVISAATLQNLAQVLAEGFLTDDNGIWFNSPTLNDITKGIRFGDGDTGIYEFIDDILEIKVGNAGLQIRGTSGNIIQHRNNLGFYTRASNSATVPMYAARNDENTGIGFTTGDVAHLIAGGNTMLTWNTTGATVEGTLTLNSTTGTAVTGLGLDSSNNVVTTSLGGGGGATEIVDDNFTGTIDGSNTVYTTSVAYEATKIKVYLNGVRQKVGVDYTETNSTTITFTVAPLTNDVIIIDFYQL